MEFKDRTFESFEIFGVEIRCGEQRVHCPKCTPLRKKQNIKDLSVNFEKGTWYCHHCGLSGALVSGWEGELKEDFQNTFSLKKYPLGFKVNKNMDQRKSYNVSELTVCPYVIGDDNELSEEDYGWFLEKRGLSEDTLINNHIIRDSSKYIPALSDKVLAYGFPYHSKVIDPDKGWVVLNIKWRTPTKEFVSEKGCGRYMYRWDSLYEENGAPVDSFIITEGELDALSAVEAGFHAVTSVPDGAPDERAKQVDKKLECLNCIRDVYTKASRIILAIDNDAPGKVLRNELIKVFGQSKCYDVEYPEGCKDLNDVLLNHGKDAVVKVLSQATPLPVQGITNASEIRNDIHSYCDNGSGRGILTGWSVFDEFYTIKTGEMNVVTGIPSHGKSSFIDALLVNLAKMNNWSFAIFSPENYPLKRHIKKYIEIYCGRPFFGKAGVRLESSFLDEYIDWVGNHFYFVGSDPDIDEELTLDNILSKVAVCVNRFGVKGFVIDPWNEIEHNRPAKWSETEYISSCLGKIRKFARSYDVAAWIIAHPAKQMKREDGSYMMPSAYDISGSANWRNKADNVLCVYRKNLDKTDCIVEIQKIKFREVGKVGSVSFSFDISNGRYEALPTSSTSAKISSN